ncbi:MAG TPA: acyl-ACP desaturase [Acidimicrobiales bacterium]|nr:acyl-ACP desaturase [Acidimicrobiales bacterium]
MTTFQLSEVVEDAACRLLERHLRRAKEWFPHELVPWSRGHDFDAGTASEPQGGLPEGVASALWVGLLTEDNLPHYFHVIARAFPCDSAMGEWARRWAAEEGRHAIVIRDWISVTRSLDLVALERARMRQLTSGFDQGARGETLTDAMAYLALQELATRISHWNTGQHLDPSGAAVMRRVAADENLHFLFYRDMVTLLLQADPSEGVRAIDRQVTGFAMPGAGIADFSRHASRIAAAGIYDYRVHYEQILLPVVVNHWRIACLTGLTPDGERARDHLLARIARTKRVAERIQVAAPAG